MFSAGLLILVTAVKLSVQCGYYQAVDEYSSGVITSPNYPNEYKIMDNCIWVYEAPPQYVLQFNIGPINTDSSINGACQDYLRLTDGGPHENEVATLCDTRNDTIIQSNGRHAWLQFWSDYQFVGTGFSANWSVVYTGQNTTTSIPSCNITHYTCANRQCVFTSYLCDNVNDCGCDGYLCDEGDCTPYFVLTKAQHYGLCIGIGTAVFFALFFSCLLLERQDMRPNCCEKSATNENEIDNDDYNEENCGFACLNRCRSREKDDTKETKSYRQMMAMMERTRNPISSSWYSVSENGSPSQSIYSPSSRGSIVSEMDFPNRRLSSHTDVIYGNKLSPMNIPQQRTETLSRKLSSSSAQIAFNTHKSNLTIPSISFEDTSV